MINLLPTDYKLGLHYGRLNLRLARWLVFGIAIIGGLLLILGSGWLYMEQQTKDLNRSISTTQNQLKAQDLEQVRGQADEISKNIRVINQVLGREIRFSSLLQEIGQAMPPGTVLNSLTLSDKVSNAIDLNASTKNSTASAQITVNLSDPKNNLFTKVDLVSVTCSSEEKNYPCAVKLRALFDKKIFERFLNAASGDSQ